MPRGSVTAAIGWRRGRWRPAQRRLAVRVHTNTRRLLVTRGLESTTHHTRPDVKCDLCRPFKLLIVRFRRFARSEHASYVVLPLAGHIMYGAPSDCLFVRLLQSRPGVNVANIG